MRDGNPAATFTRASKALASFGLAYLHVVEPEQLVLDMRLFFDGPFILNGGYGAETGAAALKRVRQK